MTRWNGQVVISSCCALLCAGAAFAQGRGGNDWATAGNDAQRSGWVRTDPKISPASMAKPGFAFLWKQKVGEAKQLNSLTEAVLMDRYIGFRGFRSLAHLGVSGDKIVAFDTDLGRVEWQKPIGTPSSQTGTIACPGGLTTSLARPVSAALACTGGRPPRHRGGRSPAPATVGSTPGSPRCTPDRARRPGRARYR